MLYFLHSRSIMISSHELKPFVFPQKPRKIPFAPLTARHLHLTAPLAKEEENIAVSPLWRRRPHVLHKRVSVLWCAHRINDEPVEPWPQSSGLRGAKLRPRLRRIWVEHQQCTFPPRCVPLDYGLALEPRVLGEKFVLKVLPLL